MKTPPLFEWTEEETKCSGEVIAVV